MKRYSRAMVYMVAVTLLFFGSFSLGHTQTASQTPADDQATQNVNIEVSDDAVYHQGWYATQNQPWRPFTFSNNQVDGWVLDGQARATLALPEEDSDENFVLIYSCTQDDENWDCHENQWQTQRFLLGQAAAGSCDDGIQNQDETGVDCGGSCTACDDDSSQGQTNGCIGCGTGEVLKPEHLHLMWESSNETHSSMTVIWEEDAPGEAGSSVYYDTVPGLCQEKRFSQVPVITSTPKGRTVVRSAKLQGLSQNTTYYFCVTDNSAASKEYHFRTAPAAGTNFSFIVGSDSQYSVKRKDFGRLTATAMSQEPLFILHTGDGPEGGSYTYWKRWLGAIAQFVSPTGRLIPIIPAVGNHDMDMDGISHWHAHYTLPGNELYFYHDIGGLRVITLYVPGEEDSPGIDDQVPFLQAALAGAKAAGKWIVVQYHKPMYPTYHGVDSDTVKMRTVWEPLFDTYRVHLALEGHDHVYKRTYPLLGGQITDAATGTVHMGDGGWAVSRQRVQKSNKWPLETYNFSSYVARINMYGGVMSLATINEDGGIIDQSTIPK